MHRSIEKQHSNRAHSLGESGDSSAVPELIEFLASPSAQVRRLAASALGKLAGIADSQQVIPHLVCSLRDSHPQVRQYSIKALSAYGTVARSALPDLNDITENPTEKEYNRRDAANAIETINEASRIALKESAPRCQKCNSFIDEHEYSRSMKAFQRAYCDLCFNEVYLRRRNFDTQVELNKTIPTTDGKLVQSDGERIIADYLARHAIAYRYDERMQIIDGYAIRPDFYLPEFDIYIEYWGMDTAKYKIGMLKKQELYQQQGKKLISLSYKDKPHLEERLQQKLSRYVNL